MFIFILVFYLIFCYIYRKNKVLLLLFLIQVISVISAMLINAETYGDDISTYYNVPYILASTLMLILPWKKYGQITSVLRVNAGKVNLLTNFLLIISAFTFVVLLAVAIVVMVYLGDTNINEYKDDTTNFYYTMLPFDVHWYLWARVLYTFSYFLIPLHFYHLYEGNRKKSVLCAFLSLNIVLYGLAFFSRWTIMLFVCLYGIMWFMFKNVLSQDDKKRERKAFFYVMIFLTIAFVSITLGRFSSDDGVSTRYAERIPQQSYIQDPALYSICDYLGQSSSIGVHLLNTYNGQHFGFKYPLMSLQNLFAGVGLCEPSTIFDLHQIHWKDEWDKFPGFTVYGVYDLGYIGAFICCILYFFIVNKRNRKIRLQELLAMVVLIQMPICSIFYSQANEVLYDLMFLIPIWIFLQSGTQEKKIVR